MSRDQVHAPSDITLVQNGVRLIYLLLLVTNALTKLCNTLFTTPFTTSATPGAQVRVQEWSTAHQDPAFRIVPLPLL